MEKIKVEDMACFEQVAKVIGVANAKRELFIAMKAYTSMGLCVNFHDDLFYSFHWDSTPQEYAFWSDINDGINPYNQ